MTGPIEKSGKGRLLLVDDDPVAGGMLALMLKKHGYAVRLAQSGEACLACVEAFSPELILLDIEMPGGIDGYETCRRLKANPVFQDIPVIFVTGHDNPGAETRGLKVGAVDFISKPANPAVVRARVNTHLTLKRQADLLRSQAFIDGLTSIPNRRQFDASLENEWRVCRRSRSSLALCLLDIDHFKQFNDAYGHQAGDACLQAVARVLKAGVGRPRDVVARFGGEEFVCLLPDTDLAGAKVKAEELKQAVQELDIGQISSGGATMVTVSIGVAALTPDAEARPDQLLGAADERLYAAKRDGRNLVRCAELNRT